MHLLQFIFTVGNATKHGMPLVRGVSNLLKLSEVSYYLSEDRKTWQWTCYQIENKAFKPGSQSYNNATLAPVTHSSCRRNAGIDLILSSVVSAELPAFNQSDCPHFYKCMQVLTSENAMLVVRHQSQCNFVNMALMWSVVNTILLVSYTCTVHNCTLHIYKIMETTADSNTLTVPSILFVGKRIDVHREDKMYKVQSFAPSIKVVL